MAVELLKSASLTDRDATPPVLQSPGTGGVGTKKFVQGYVATVPASSSVGSILRLVQVPAHCYVKSVKLYSAAQTAGAFDIGVYAAPGGAVIDADYFASAVSCASVVQGTEVALESTVATVAHRIQPLWQALGVSTAPAKGTMYEIAATCATTAVTTGLGALGIEVEYVD